ncbi:MAG: PH domain-containing protein, partial [Candidatus Kariarchaeaceae archaeon]
MATKGTIEQFKPSGKLLMRDYLETTIIYILGATVVLFILMAASNDGDKAGIHVLFILLAIGTVVWLVSFVFLKLWIDSFKYEFTKNEIIVHKGWVTKSKKIVPYRTITNFHKKRGPFDRLMGLATMEIETAGRSGSKTGPEEKLEGILVEEVDQFINLVRAKVKHLKGIGATTHDEEISEKPFSSSDDILLEILSQLKDIK